MKVKDVIRAIEQDGWRFHSQRGSHRQFKKGMLASIYRQAQIDKK
jgi:predicted RNA binding protein YcfA (HicA-like mRNA interferase family)